MTQYGLVRRGRKWGSLDFEILLSQFCKISFVQADSQFCNQSRGSYFLRVSAFPSCCSEAASGITAAVVTGRAVPVAGGWSLCAGWHLQCCCSLTYISNLMSSIACGCGCADSHFTLRLHHVHRQTAIKQQPSG